MACIQSGRCTALERAVGRVTTNVLLAFAAGPAGAAHPSSPNLATYGLALADPIDP